MLDGQENITSYNEIASRNGIASRNEVALRNEVASRKSNIIDYESAKTRFGKNLPKKPYCTNDLMYGTKIRPREQALRCVYIQLNRKLRFYLPFDIDREGAAFAYEDAGLPAPTIIIVNPENAHAHLLYELSHPVAFKDRNGNGNARNAPMKFYEALYRGMVERLDADRGYVQLICKNPWHSRWETIYHDSAVYALGELADYVNPIWNTGDEAERNEVPQYSPETLVYEGMRNDFLFDVARKKGYELVRHIDSYDELFEKILEFSEQVNRIQLIPPLSQSDVKAKAKSIAGYCVKHRSNILNYGERNRGAMNLDRIQYPLDRDDLKDEIKHRQHLGALYTALKRWNETAKKIRAAIHDLISNGEKVTMGKVSKMIQISKSTLSECYRDLFYE